MNRVIKIHAYPRTAQDLRLEYTYRLAGGSLKEQTRHFWYAVRRLELFVFPWFFPVARVGVSKLHEKKGMAKK